MSEPEPRRGRAHDAEGAREAILNAAEAVFAEHGFDGARIDVIAKASITQACSFTTLAISSASMSRWSSVLTEK